MSFQLFDKIRAFLKNSNIYTHENLLQNQSDINRVVDSGEIINYASSGIIDQTNLQINRHERYKDFDQMSEMGEISLALDLYADESCLDGDTVIPLLDGTYPTIRELANKGVDHEFWVYAYDIKNKYFVPTKAYAARITKYNQEMVSVILDNNIQIKCTPDHKFLTINGWIESSNLKKDDELISYAYSNHKVISVEPCGFAKEVFDIEVPNFNCFAAGDEKSWVVVHNCQFDPETKHTIGIKAKDQKVKEELEFLFFDTLNIDKNIRAISRYLCKYGDFAAEIVVNENRDAVTSFRPFNIFNFLRVETKFGDLVGFFFTDEMMSEPIFMHPWQVMHLRLTTYENIYNPYGMSVLDGSRKDFRRLRLMEDAALIYRIVRSPEKRVFTIPVGNIPTAQVQQYLNQIADQFKKQRFYDPATGEVNWRYAPLIQEDDFFLPVRPDGTGPKIDKLPGAENLDQIKDIEYFKKKMIAPLKIPFSRVGIGEEAGNADRSLSSTHTDFAKAVQFVQRELAIGLKKMAIVHLLLKGYDADQVSNFNIHMTSSSAIDELYRIETWNSRAGVIGTLKETGLFPDEWILSRFTDMTDDEIEELKELREKEKEKAAEGEEEEGGLPMGLPGLEDIDKQEAKVILEYAKMREKKIKEEKYNDTLNYLINNNELNGIIDKEKEKTITDDINTEYTEMFDIINEEVINTDKPVENSNEFDEEEREAIELNKNILTKINDISTAHSMSVSITEQDLP